MFSEYLIMATQNIWPEESCCRHFLCKLISNSWISAPPLHQCNLVDLICVECYCSHAFKFTYFPPSCVSFFVEPGFVSWFSRGLYFAATIPLLSIKKALFKVTSHTIVTPHEKSLQPFCGFLTKTYLCRNDKKSLFSELLLLWFIY